MTQMKGKNRGDWWRSIIVPALLALAIVLVAGVLLDHQNMQIAEARQRADVLAELSVIRAKLEGNVASNVQLVKGLISVIATEPNMDQERYTALVQNLFEEESQLRSVAAAPDLVVSMTYPLEGNASVIGLNYRNTPHQWYAVDHVVRTGEMSIAGPVDLVQGGRGFIGRFPVHTGENNERRLWGVVSAVLDVDRLYADSGLSTSNLTISITGQDGTGATGPRFFGPDLRDQTPVSVRVMLPAGSWQLAAIPSGGWSTDPFVTWGLRGLIVLAGALILFPIVLTARIIGERQAHITELNARSGELALLGRRLNLALSASKVGVWEMDVETETETWDARTNELHGMPNDGMPRTHEHWKNSVHPEDQAEAEKHFRQIMTLGRDEWDYRVLLPDGTLRHIRSIGSLSQEAGQPDKIIGVNWDVTADVGLNEALRLAKRQTEQRNAELEAARIRIEYDALHDSLTGLPNRRYLDEMLQRHAADGYHGTGSIALLHIDLDRFKQINDTLGHAAGDAMLIHASEVLRANSRETDFVARIGGDEFVIVSSAGSTDTRLQSMAERIVREMRRPVIHHGHECRFGVSIGLAVGREANIDVRQMLINADIALYRAKARGRNRYEFFSEALQAEVVTTKRVADEILSALDRGDFVPFYQPQFDAKTLDLAGVEALARWQHPTEGIKTPDRFMAIAEELNVMAQIDGLILDQALADLARWDNKCLAVPRVSVNVSLRRLHDEGLMEGLKLLPLMPGRLAFELVESIYLDESDGVVGWNIDQIKDLGIDVEIDDFGTGYASIVSLQKLRPRRLKIDRQLIMPILSDPAQRKLVGSIVDIGKSMDIEIVAEGVETLEHVQILRDLGCDILQGYAFARPMCRTAFEDFLRRNDWRKAS